MGVRGLTTYIHSHSDTFFFKHDLHDCTLIIDGNSLAAVLYCAKVGSYSAFGGDYDSFGEHINHFVATLRKCNIKPIFIFDGAYEGKKASTVRRRNAMKVYCIDKVTPDRPSRDFFPLMMRPVLQERLMELGVTCLQSDYEADREIAAVAKQLNAPVLSNDSDFFIFDVPYIPLSTFPLDDCHSSSNKINFYYYIPCKIFYLETFLKYSGGLKKTHLPLLATILGNDYVSRSSFKNFFGLIKKDKCKKMSLEQRKVGGLVKWLKEESFETALCKVLASLPKARRQQVKNHINSIITGYSDVSTCLESYITTLPRIYPKDDDSINICAHLEKLDIKEGESTNLQVDKVTDNDSNYLGTNEEDKICKYFDSHDEVEESGNSEDLVEELDKNKSEEGSEELCEELINEAVEDNNGEVDKPILPPWFLERSRQCLLAPQVLTLFTLKTYFCVPQVEDCSMHHAGEIGIPILQVIAGVALGNTTINYWYNHGLSNYRLKTIETIHKLKLGALPNVWAINKYSPENRKDIILNVMSAGNETLLNSFPEDWQLYIICIIYWLKNKEILRSYHLHAIVMMSIAVHIIQNKVGVFRKQKLFLKKFGNQIKTLQKQRESMQAKINENKKPLIEELAKISVEDCIIIYETCLPYFIVDETLKERPRTFSRAFVHTFAEFQTVLHLTQMLNSLLLHPYKPVSVSKFYNGTLLYNFVVNFKNQSDINRFLEKMFNKAPSLLNVYMIIYSHLAQFLRVSVNLSKEINHKRHKKRRRKTHTDVNKIEVELSNEEEGSGYCDKNNKFFILQGSQK